VGFVSLLLLLAGLSEALGVASLLPLLGILTGDSNENASGAVERSIESLIESVGLRPTIGTVLTIVVAGTVFKALMNAVAMREAGHTTARMAADLRLGLIRSLMMARWSHFTEQSLGGLANSMSNEATRASFVFFVSAVILSSTLQAIFYGALALAVSPYATAGAFVFGLSMFFLFNSLIRMSRDAGEQQTAVLGSLISRLTDGINAIKPLKAMAREEGLQPLLEAETKSLLKAQERQTSSAAILTSAQEIFTVLVIGIGIYFAITRLDMDLPRLLFITFLFQRMAGRAGEIQSRYQQIAEYESALWSVEESIQRSTNAKELITGVEIPSLEESIRLEGITFRYGATTVFEQLDARIPARTMVAIIGPSGVGKTTLIDLVTGLVEPEAGSIYIDGTSLARVDIRAWRRKIGYVPQEVILVHDSVLVNVTLGDETLTPGQVEQALRAADAWDFVQRMPEGVLTTVGEHGMKLSGGQRQRLAIARALIRDPELLILDEATTALDPRTEEEIAQSLLRLRRSLTILAVSHQTRLVELADSVIELGGGDVVKAKDRTRE
jgi:ATP-binding cassette subfamily C protein